MELDALEPERVEDLFSRYGAHAVTLQAAGDDAVLEPAPGETPLWAATRITGLFDADADLEPLMQEMRRVFELEKLPDCHVEQLDDREWEREWLKDFRPMRFGRRLWVCPHAAESPANDALIVRLDPGLAFGTGTHATTALCLGWLDSLDLNGKTIVDLGCGSGILTIAALLLGAEHAEAIDIDPQALIATRQNAETNGVADRVSTAATLDAVDDCDVLVANILAGPLVDLAEHIASKVKIGGLVAVSGLLVDQEETVRAAYSPWFQLQAAATRDGWIRLNGTRVGN